jgi:SWIM zinc finger
VSLTRERIESLAPDLASLAAALKLVKPAAWPVLAADAGASVLWGECQGSGATPYRVVVSPEETSYKCTCPSRKFPCKHVLAVLWLRLDKPERFESTSPPQWVEEWSARRRAGSGRLATRKQADPAPWPRSPRGLGPALREFASCLGALPWLDGWPLMMDGVAIRTSGKGALVIADDLGRAIPVERSQAETLTPMIGLDGLSLLCIWDGRVGQVVATDTPIGCWHGR